MSRSRETFGFELGQMDDTFVTEIESTRGIINGKGEENELSFESRELEVLVGYPHRADLRVIAAEIRLQQVED